MYSYIQYINQYIYSVKYSIYWLLSWIKVKGLMDGNVWDILRIKNKKLDTINGTVPFLNWWGKSLCIIGAEKHRNFYSRQYGDWGPVFIVNVLEGPEMESQWGRNLTWCPYQSWCRPSVLNNGQESSLLGVKRLVCGISHPPPSSSSVKEWGMENDIEMDLQEVEWGDTDWIYLAYDRNRWQALMNAVINLQAP